MATLLTFVSGAVPVRGLAALKAKQHQLSHRWQRARAQRRKVARITHELEMCTDRELNELGLGRGDIPAVAHGTYRRG